MLVRSVFPKIKFGKSFPIMVMIFFIPVLYKNLSFSSFLESSVYLLFTIFSLYIHELFHVIAANFFGLGSGSTIKFWAMGGFAHIPDLGKTTPRQHIIISIAGPISNIILLIPIFLYLFVNQYTLENLQENKHLFFLFLVNLILGIFNLIPAYPLDGGRILRSILVKKQGFVRATLTSCKIGLYISILIIVFGILLGQIGTALLGVLVFYTGWQNLREFKKSKTLCENSIDKENIL